MNIFEAAKLSKKIINRDSGKILSFEDHIYGKMSVSYSELITENWQPIIEKKTVTKKFYQVLYRNPSKEYFIADKVFETINDAQKYCEGDFELIRFLVENPIEVEVEE